MKLPVATRCPHCAAESFSEYISLGRAVECAACGLGGIAEVVVGSTFPLTGCAIRFADFFDLAAHGSTQEKMNSFLTRWFGVQAVGEGAELSIVGREGLAVDPFELHLEIQADAERQADLYNFAMTVWHS